MITFSWQITPEQVWPQISQRQIATIERELVKLCDKMRGEIAAYMKANHPWENVTGAAEAGLHAELVHVLNEFAGVMFAHGDDVAHAWYLETMQRGRFGIIAPTLDVFGARLLTEVKAIVRKYSS